MKKELNIIEIFNGVKGFLRKYCKHHNIEDLSFTLMVYYRAPEQGAVFIENGDINKEQRKECLKLLATMLDTKTETSAPFDCKGGQQIGGIATDTMVIIMAGVEPVLAKALITKMLHYHKVFTHVDFERIYDYLKNPDIFAILGTTGTITTIILSAAPISRGGFFDCFFLLNTYI